MDSFYVTRPEDFELYKNYTVYVKGTQSFSLKPSWLEKIKAKIDVALREGFNPVYEKAMDYVEPETQNQFFEEKKEDLKDKIDDINAQRSEVINNPENPEDVLYVPFFDKEISKLQKQLIKYIVAQGKPNQVSSFVLPKMVVKQLKKNSIRNWDKVYDVTDDVILSFVEKLDKSQLGKLRKYIQEKVEESNAIDPDDPMNSPPAPVLEDDFIVENVTPQGRSR